MKILIIGCEGYIGTSLRNFLKHCDIKHDVMGIDILLNVDFCELKSSDIEQYDCIVLLAAHSSVSQCINDSMNSLTNNVIKFINFTKLLNMKQKFIYMSSSSVYGITHGEMATEMFELKSPHNEYDFGKQVIDEYMLASNLNYYGLRLGTVNGHSDKTRYDLAINSMVKDAKTKNIIQIYNGDIYRAILDIQDLNRVIYTIINSEIDKPGIYNIASFNSTMYNIGKNVSKLMKVPFIQPIVYNKPKSTYDFSISSEKFCQTYNFKFIGTVDSIVNSLKNEKYN